MPPLLQKLFRYSRHHGLRAMAGRVWQEYRDYVRIRPAVHGGRRFAEPNALLAFLFSDEARLIRPSQIPGELGPLLACLNASRPRLVLEIGTNNGGTLFAWTRVAAEDAEIISLDLPGGRFGGGYPAWKRPLYRAFALPGQKLHLLECDSHAARSISRVRQILDGRQLDFLMIDGDHTYEGVKLDYENYAPLVRPGGLIAFHDIAEHHDPTCEVRRYWLEVSQDCAARELIASPPQGWAGIGVLERR